MATPQLQAKASERMSRLGKLVRPITSAIKQVKTNTLNKVKRKERKKEEEPKPETGLRTPNVVIGTNDEGKTTFAVHGNRPKTKKELQKEYDKIGIRYENAMKRGGKRTRKRKRRKRKTRKRKRRRTKKRRKSRRRKRRRTRK